MSITDIILICIGLLLIINIWLNAKKSSVKANPGLDEMKFSIQAIHQSIKDSESSVKTELTTNRLESSQNARDLRTETTEHLGKMTSSNEGRLDKLRETIEEKLGKFQVESDNNNREGRKELRENLTGFKNELNTSWKDFKESQIQNFSGLAEKLGIQGKANSDSLKEMKEIMERSIKNLQDGNEVKLEEMRKTVDEKLEKTLETRLTQSFNLVSERLETVHKGLGEMQQLAIGVGDLKRVLTNVKTRGVLGEVQLSNILEQLLAPEQYEVNCITKTGTNNRVEFAIKIPQQNQENKVLMMPIDSKFPIEDYYTLQAAHESHDIPAAEAAGRALENSIKKSAKDIHEKYICPPDTSEIGLLFLPIEGLYAEVVRRPALMETLQREYQIIVTGPTTLSAILSTISFGYKTMAMEQRSGEIKKTLSAVRTEFNKFGDVLKKAQEKINKASEDIDELVGTRTRKIQIRLKSFDELPTTEATALLGTENEAETEVIESPQKQDGLSEIASE